MPSFDRRTVCVKKRMDTWTGSIRTDVRMTVTSGESEEGAAFVSEAIYCLPIFNRDLKQGRKMVEIC